MSNENQTPKRNTLPKDERTARRKLISDAYIQVLNAANGPLTRAEISRRADTALGRPGTPVTWVDGGLALAGFVKDGLVAEWRDEGKRRTLFRRIATDN
jgi:hypothetical protein